MADYFYVVSDSSGFVGAYRAISLAEETVSKYAPTPFIIQKFPVKPGPTETVWVVLYRDIDAVAFVSNDRADAERVQALYASVGLTYLDSIDHWEQPADRIAASAEARLESLGRAYTLFADGAAERFEDRMLHPDPNSPLVKLIRENERMDVLDGVILINTPRGPRT